MGTIISGVKVITHNAGHINEPDDPSFPFKIEVNLSPPEFMQVAFIMRYGGSEIIVVRAKTKRAMDAFLKANDFRSASRLRQMKITGPKGVIEEIDRTKSQKKIGSRASSKKPR